MNVENIRKLRNVKEKIKLKDIPTMFQSIKPRTPEKESSDMRQHELSYLVISDIDIFYFSAEFLLDVLGLINKQNSLILDKCPRGYKCVEKPRFGGGLFGELFYQLKKIPQCFQMQLLRIVKNVRQQTRATTKTTF